MSEVAEDLIPIPDNLTFPGLNQQVPHRYGIFQIEELDEDSLIADHVGIRSRVSFTKLESHDEALLGRCWALSLHDWEYSCQNAVPIEDDLGLCEKHREHYRG